MKWNFMEKALILIIALITAYCAIIITQKPDSPVEEAAEAVINYELGLPPGTIDLSNEDKRK